MFCTIKMACFIEIHFHLGRPTSFLMLKLQQGKNKTKTQPKQRKQRKGLFYENTTPKYSRRPAKRTGFAPAKKHTHLGSRGANCQEKIVVIHNPSFIWKDKGEAGALIDFPSWKVSRSYQESYNWQLQSKCSKWHLEIIRVIEEERS